jgi:beta-galactosidase GanA
MEPQEGRFDFIIVDGLIQGARQHHVRLVLLWFGSWKNSMSSYAPDWVKENQQRFPPAARVDGTSLAILSALSQNNVAADSKAFVALMRHLKQIDSADDTVILVQVENEVGMIPDARDHSAAANSAFFSPVPVALTSYLSKNKDFARARAQTGMGSARSEGRRKLARHFRPWAWYG